MPKFEINESLYDPIEINIGGELFVLTKPITTEFMVRYDECHQKAQKGEVMSAAEQLHLITTLSETPLKIENAKKIDLRIITDVNMFFMECIWKAEKKDDPLKKKVENPGQTKPLK